MSDSMPAKALRPGHIVETLDGHRFTVLSAGEVNTAHAGLCIQVHWSDDLVEWYSPDDLLDVVGEVRL